MEKKRGGRPFVKNDPRINRKGTSNPGVAGRPSELHRAECRRLFEEGGLRDLIKDAAKGEAVDFYVNIAGKVSKVPTNFRNRLIAMCWLGEQGYGKAPQEVTHTVSDEALEAFQTKLLSLFQKYFPKNCPHCRTAIAMSPEIAQEILALSKIFEVARDASPVEA